MATKIDTVTARDKLSARHAPYWHKLRFECHIGFRKTTPDSFGTWVARFRNSDGAYQLRSFGSLDEHTGGTRFGEASNLASVWFDHLSKGGSSKSNTVQDVCDAYIEHVEQTKSLSAALDASRNASPHNFSLTDTDLTKLILSMKQCVELRSVV